MADVVGLLRRPDGVAVTHRALSPKHLGGWHTLSWVGPDPRYPSAMVWSDDPSEAAVFATEEEAVDAFAAHASATAVSDRYQLPAVQLTTTTAPEATR